MSRRILLSCGRAVGSYYHAEEPLDLTIMRTSRWIFTVVGGYLVEPIIARNIFQVLTTQPYTTPEGGVVIRRLTVHFLRSMMLSDSANMYGRMNSFF